MIGPYQFKEEDALEFARSIGAKTFTHGKELFFTSCPYCHSTKDKNSFSIDLRTGRFNCFRASCGVTGNMITLAQDFDFSLGQNADEYIRPRKRYKVWNAPEKPIEPKEVALAYLEDRGISPETIRRYQITSKDNLVVFTFFDQHGQPQTIKYRNTQAAEGQSKEWFEKNCKPILYGMEQCNTENKTLIVTEGQIDSLSVAEAGLENAVSVPGGVNSFTWVPYCWDWIQQFDKIIVFGDHERGTVTLYADFLQRWKNKVWCVRPEDYLDCKDANDILRKYGPEQIRKAVENAKQPPISNIVDLADVEEIDVNELEKLPTGIMRLDDTLRGGLPFGQLVLITGKSGDGKSTIANQIIVGAIDQMMPVFIYSGELPNFMLKSWITFQAAGPGHTHSSKRYGSKAYEVDADAKARIREWMRGRVWIYDNRIATDEDMEQIKLIELLEDVIERKGARVILLDNLMTALDLEPDGNADKYDRQSAFMKKLARLALKHNALIILVAHKRKMGSSETNDTVSGSADIVNLASIVISYERGKPEDGDNIRWLKLTKNRVFGRLNNGIKLTFDEKSRRVHEVDADPAWKYSWEFDDQGVDDLPWED